MSEEKPSQSFSISGGQISDVQIGGMAGKNINVTQNKQVITNESSQPLTQADVVELIIQLEDLFSNSMLPGDQTAKAMRYLQAAREEAQEEEPDRDFTAQSLQKATKILQQADETLEKGTSLWDEVQPIIKDIVSWLGVAAGFFFS